MQWNEKFTSHEEGRKKDEGTERKTDRKERMERER